MIPVALLAGLLATTVEAFKLYHSPGLDVFRLTISASFCLAVFFLVGILSRTVLSSV